MGRWGQRRCEHLCRSGAICSLGDTRGWKESEGTLGQKPVWRLGCGESWLPGRTRCQESHEGQCIWSTWKGQGINTAARGHWMRRNPQAMETPKHTVGDCRGRRPSKRRVGRGSVSQIDQGSFLDLCQGIHLLVTPPFKPDSKALPSFTSEPKPLQAALP